MWTTHSQHHQLHCNIKQENILQAKEKKKKDSQQNQRCKSEKSKTKPTIRNKHQHIAASNETIQRPKGIKIQLGVLGVEKPAEKSQP